MLCYAHAVSLPLLLRIAVIVTVLTTRHCNIPSGYTGSQRTVVASGVMVDACVV